MLPLLRIFIVSLLLLAPGLSVADGTITVAPQPQKEETPFRADSGLTKAEYLLTAGKFSAALAEAEAVLARQPGNADAYTYRGYAYLRLGETEDAANSFRNALKFSPTHLGANKYLADLYLEAGDLPRALEQMQVIRMTCAGADCAELRTLERAIDRHKRGGAGEEE